MRLAVCVTQAGFGTVALAPPALAATRGAVLMHAAKRVKAAAAAKRR